MLLVWKNQLPLSIAGLIKYTAPASLGFFICCQVFNGFNDNLFKFKQRSVVSSTIPISEKLEISVDRRLKTSHGSYATTLKGSYKSRDVIGEMMGYSASQITEHIWRVWI